MNGIGTFKDREEAGKALAEALRSKALPDPVVLALPRGGVPVAAEVARALNAPLDLVMVRKIGVPYQPELAAAAIIDGEHPQLVINEEVCALADVSRSEIDAMAKQELEEIDRRTKLYLKDRPRAPIAGRSAIVVDDGIATGTTIRAVIRALRLKGPKSIVIAVPVAPPDVVWGLREEADDIVCLHTPEPFFAIGLYYLDFHQIPDEEVIRLLLIGRPEVEKAAVPAPPAKAVEPIPREKAIVPRPRAKAALPVAKAKPEKPVAKAKPEKPMAKAKPGKPVAGKPKGAAKRKKAKAPARRARPRKPEKPS
jgi:putative phosphoribosyl transferase